MKTNNYVVTEKDGTSGSVYTAALNTSASLGDVLSDGSTVVAVFPDEQSAEKWATKRNAE